MHRILIVDDEEDVRITLRMALCCADYEIMEAANGLEADKLLTEHPFDLAIIDMIMPDKEGISLISDIKRDIPDLKIIAISGGGRWMDPTKAVESAMDHLEAATEFGAEYTLQKPFGIDILLQYVDDCLSTYQT